MKKYLLLLVLPVLIFTGCVENGLKDLENNETPDQSEVQNEAPKYTGNWFEINYPKDFAPSPTEPLQVWEDISYIETDEAYFLSPDQSVEFFVYSPQWDGEPKDYLMAKENEEIFSEEKTEEENIVKTETIFKEKNAEYFRKALSTRETLGDTKLHWVFGIKYVNEDALANYEEDFNKFKESLVQFAD